MKITIKDVEHVAGLARLQFKDAELEAMTAQLNGILDSFDKLQTVDTTGIEPSTHAVDVSNAFRDDEVRPLSRIARLGRETCTELGRGILAGHDEEVVERSHGAPQAQPRQPLVSNTCAPCASSGAAGLSAAW